VQDVICDLVADESLRRRTGGAPSAALIRQAIATAVTGGGSLRERRRTFLRACWPHLGPTQRQHISGHCWAVSTVAARLGRILKLADADVNRLAIAGLFHDIGKCLIGESILDKPAQLTAAERVVMGRHVQIGARIAAELEVDGETLRLILHHHTPALGAGDSADEPGVPQAAHLLSVADALVSMMSDRPYCAARTAGEALAELRRHAGTQFDTISVDTAHHLYRRHRAA